MRAVLCGRPNENCPRTVLKYYHFVSKRFLETVDTIYNKLSLTLTVDYVECQYMSIPSANGTDTLIMSSLLFPNFQLMLTTCILHSAPFFSV